MKVSAKQYARGLFELIVDKSEEEAKILFTRFIEFLHGRQDLNRAEEIIEELSHIYEEANGELRAELISARPLSEKAKRQVISYLEKRAGVGHVQLSEKIDPVLLGGFVLRYNGLVVDGSLKNNLRKFEKQLSN
jgi:F-type H+-transporting ATPase subunit delta